MIEPGEVTEICYLTHDLESATARWARTVGAGPFFEMPCPDGELLLRGQPIRDSFRAVLGFSGNTVIEFIQPLSEGPSLFTEVLAEKGEGAVHHVYPNIRALNAAQYDALCKEYEADGLDRVLDFTVPGIGRNCFYDARARICCYIEVLEVNEGAFAMMDRMLDAHRAGPGDRPLRSAAEIL